MTSGIIQSARVFASEVGGAAAVEFTIVAALLMALVFAILETGVTFLFGLSVENTTQSLARMLQTGQLRQLGVASAADLKSKVICPSGGGGLLPSFVDCNRIVVDIRSAASYARDPSIGFYRGPAQFCPETTDQIVVLRVAYGLPVFLPALALGNAVFGLATTGIVDDYPQSVGWTHLLADAMTVQIEGAEGAGAAC